MTQTKVTDAMRDTTSLDVSDLSGAVPVAKGGTGATTHTANNVLVGNGTSAIASVAPSTSGNVLTSTGSAWASTAPAGGGLTVRTATATTSGTSVNYGGIPSGTSLIFVMFSGWSNTSGYDGAITIGDSGGIETSGYSSDTQFSRSNGTTYYATGSSAFLMKGGWGSLAFHGQMVLTLLDSSTNLWASSHSLSGTFSGGTVWGGGSKALSGELTQVQFSATPSATFTGGSVNISYM